MLIENEFDNIQFRRRYSSEFNSDDDNIEPVSKHGIGPHLTRTKREGRARMVRYLITWLKEYAKHAALEAEPWSAHHAEMKFMKGVYLLREKEFLLFKASGRGSWGFISGIHYNFFAHH